MREDLQIYPVFLHQQGLFKRRLKEFKLQINCPGCGKKTTYSRANENRPFCSASCKNKDIIAWANEENKFSTPIENKGHLQDVSED